MPRYSCFRVQDTVTISLIQDATAPTLTLPARAYERPKFCLEPGHYSKWKQKKHQVAAIDDLITSFTEQNLQIDSGVTPIVMEKTVMLTVEKLACRNTNQQHMPLLPDIIQARKELHIILDVFQYIEESPGGSGL